MLHYTIYLRFSQASAIDSQEDRLLLSVNFSPLFLTLLWKLHIIRLSFMPVIGQAIHKQPETVTNDTAIACLFLFGAECAGQFYFLRWITMNTLLIGNIISGIGCAIMVAIGLLKKKSHILVAQCIQCGFMGAGNLILGGVSGFICNIVTILRNLVFVKLPVTTTLKVFFIGLQVVLSLNALGDGMISWLPILSAAIFTWFLDTKSEATLKKVIITTQILWLIYDIYYRNYVAVTFDVLTMCSNVVGIFLVRKAK